jgi:hypothetical protein
MSTEKYLPYHGNPAEKHEIYRRFCFRSHVIVYTVDMQKARYCILRIETEPITNREVRIGYFETDAAAITVQQLRRFIGDVNAVVYIDLDSDSEKIREFYLRDDGVAHEFGDFARKKRGRKPKNKEVIDNALHQIRTGEKTYGSLARGEDINKTIMANRSKLLDEQLLVSTKRNFKTQVYYFWGDGELPLEHVLKDTGYNDDPTCASIVYFEKSGDITCVRNYDFKDIVIVPNISMTNIHYNVLCSLCGRLPMSISIGYGNYVNWAPREIWFVNGVPSENLVPQGENASLFKSLITKEYYVNQFEFKEVETNISIRYTCCCYRDGKKCMNSCRYTYGPCAACEKWMKNNKTMLKKQCKNFENCGFNIPAGSNKEAVFCLNCRKNPGGSDHTAEQVSVKLPSTIRVTYPCSRCNKGAFPNQETYCPKCKNEMQEEDEKDDAEYFNKIGDAS